MGSFGGHALPGSFFVIFGMWWTVQIFVRYYRSLTTGGLPFKSSITFPCSCLCGKLKTWEIEGMLKIFFCFVGLVGEIITAMDHGVWVYLGNGQHSTMFVFFMMSGVVDILVHHKVPLPKNIEYVMMILAFTVEGILFKFHLHGRTELDILIHTFLLYTIYANVLVGLLEMHFRKSVLAALSRAYFVIVQGTWFWQVGFILYPPAKHAEGWDEENHDQMMIATMMFTWHMGVIFIFMLVVGGVIGGMYRCSGQLSSDEYDSLNIKLLKRGTNGHTIVDLHEDSDSDADFQEPILPNRTSS